MSQQQGKRTWLRKLDEVTHLHLVRWQCPSCGYLMEQLVQPKTITKQMCHACKREFQINGEKVYVVEPL